MKNKKPLVELLALSEKPTNQRSYRLIKFYDDNMGKFRKMLILSSDFLDSRKVYSQLIDQGLQFSSLGEKIDNIIAPLKETSKKRVKLCERPGYVLIDKKLCYLNRNGKTLGKHDGIAPMPYPESKAFVKGKNAKGTLSGWQTKIASASLNSPYIMLAICSAFSGYCIDFTDVETGGVHLFGKSSKGKSTALLVAASLYGNKDYVNDWNITEAALEELAESRNHGLLILDEVSLLDKSGNEAAQKMQKIVYMLGAEGGKQRSSFYQPRKTTWRLSALSNGELGLNEQAANGNKQRNNGEKVRFIDIPVDCDNDMGIFKTIPEGLTPSDYAESIKSACRRNYGVAGPEFVDRMLAEGSQYIKRKLKKHMDDFLEYHGISGLNGIEKRIAIRFALPYASGVLAVKLGILPFTESDVMEGVSYCYEKATGNKKTLKLNAIFNHTFKQVLKNKVITLSKCTPWQTGLEKEPALAMQVKGISVLAIESEFFKENIACGDHYLISKILKESDILIPEKGNSSTRSMTYKSKSIGRRYCLREDSIFKLLDD